MKNYKKSFIFSIQSIRFISFQSESSIRVNPNHHDLELIKIESGKNIG